MQIANAESDKKAKEEREKVMLQIQ